MSQQPPPGQYPQQTPPGGYQQPPPGGYQQQPPGGYQQQPPGYGPPGGYPPYGQGPGPSANSHMVAYGLIGLVIFIVGGIVLALIESPALFYIGLGVIAILIGYLSGGAAIGNGLARSLADAAIQGAKAVAFALGVVGGLSVICVTISTILLDDWLQDNSGGIIEIGSDNIIMIILVTVIGTAIMVLVGAAFGAVGGMFAAMQKGVR